MLAKLSQTETHFVKTKLAEQLPRLADWPYYMQEAFFEQSPYKTRFDVVKFFCVNGGSPGLLVDWVAVSSRPYKWLRHSGSQKHLHELLF